MRQSVTFGVNKIGNALRQGAAQGVDAQYTLIVSHDFCFSDSFAPGGLRPEKILPETRACLTQTGTSAGNTFSMAR